MAQPAPFTRRKAIISVLMVGWLVMLLYFLERKYDESDFRKVDALLAAPEAPWSLYKELLERNPGNEPRCEKELLSSFRGLVRVTCTASGVQPWVFEVDLVRRQLRGADVRSAEVVAAVDQKRQAADAGGPAAGAGAEAAPSGAAAADSGAPADSGQP